MNITDMADMTLFPMNLEVLKATMEIAQKADTAIMAAEESNTIEDTVELSKYVQQLFS